MNFEEANALLDEVIAFLLTTGGPYQRTSVRLETIIMDCIGSGQFIIERGTAGQITTALFYWLIHPEDMPIDIDHEPRDHYHGLIMYVAELASTGGRKELHQTMKKLRQKANFKGLFAKRRESVNYHMGTTGALWRQQQVEGGNPTATICQCRQTEQSEQRHSTPD
jgi:hypothetical protein